jgi:hypothetical protein
MEKIFGALACASAAAVIIFQFYYDLPHWAFYAAILCIVSSVILGWTQLREAEIAKAAGSPKSSKQIWLSCSVPIVLVILSLIFVLVVHH